MWSVVHESITWNLAVTQPVSRTTNIHYRIHEVVPLHFILSHLIPLNLLNQFIKSYDYIST
jgi:hypothetical protein